MTMTVKFESDGFPNIRDSINFFKKNRKDQLERLVIWKDITSNIESFFQGEGFTDIEVNIANDKDRVNGTLDGFRFIGLEVVEISKYQDQENFTVEIKYDGCNDLEEIELRKELGFENPELGPGQ